ncbi:MAG: FliM/FliN family flagellar motor switch protein [Bdellovibrionales bacterium]|nr:FliM/FliN family flagellar motor switch protein [Bdellovibrionales bacterium]
MTGEETPLELLEAYGAFSSIKRLPLSVEMENSLLMRRAESERISWELRRERMRHSLSTKRESISFNTFGETVPFFGTRKLLVTRLLYELGVPIQAIESLSSGNLMRGPWIEVGTERTAVALICFPELRPLLVEGVVESLQQNRSKMVIRAIKPTVHGEIDSLYRFSLAQMQGPPIPLSFVLLRGAWSNETVLRRQEARCRLIVSVTRDKRGWSDGRLKSPLGEIFIRARIFENTLEVVVSEKVSAEEEQRIPLEVALGGLPLTFSQILRLKPGDVISVDLSEKIVGALTLNGEVLSAVEVQRRENALVITVR